MVGERKAVAVEEGGEAAVVGGDEVSGGGVAAGELEDGVPVELLLVEALLAGDEGVGDGEDLVCGVEAGRVGVAGADREGLAADQVATR